MPDVRAVIFDMDGLLIDTEPIWRRVEIEVFGGLGLHLTEEQCLETMGVRIREVVALWHSRFPWQGASEEDVTRRIEDGVIEYVRTHGEPKPGVRDGMETVAAFGLPTAIASSSSLKLIDAVVERLALGGYVRLACSGDEEPQGKPHPGVYLSTARKLEVPPERCLALEDSPNGVLSAKAAGMYCIAVPDPFLREDPRMKQADLTLTSLEEFTPALLAQLAGLPAPA